MNALEEWTRIFILTNHVKGAKAQEPHLSTYWRYLSADNSQAIAISRHPNETTHLLTR